MSDAQDAARYRWLRGEMERLDRLAAVVVKRKFNRNGHEWAEVVDLDVTIDAIMETERASATRFPSREG